MAFIDLGDQFIALFEQTVEPRREHRHFGLVVDDVAAVLAAAHEAGASIRGNNVGDPWGNRFDVVAYRDVQFTKVEPVLRAQDATELGKSESALAELRAKGIELYPSTALAVIFPVCPRPIFATVFGLSPASPTSPSPRRS